MTTGLSRSQVRTAAPHHITDSQVNLHLALQLAAWLTTSCYDEQISNWFINARVRLWKPMIEEMYKDEFSEGSAVSRDDDTSGASSSS